MKGLSSASRDSGNHSVRPAQRIAALLVLLAFVSIHSLAQYGGNGGGSYGSKGAAIGGAIAGGAVGAGLLYLKFHHRTTLQGCVTGSGDELVNESDRQTYKLTSKHVDMLKVGDRVELSGKKTSHDSQNATFDVSKVKSLGQCTLTTAEQR